MLPAYFTLIAALIGAIVAFSTQILASRLTANRENKKILQELIAEERRLAYLLSQYYMIYIDDLVSAAFYLRMAKINAAAKIGENNDILYKSSNEAIERAAEIEEKIRLANANYFKTLTHFTNLSKKSVYITEIFKKIGEIKQPLFSFNEYNNFPDLEVAKEKETKRIKTEFKYYNQVFNEIYLEMANSI